MKKLVVLFTLLTIIVSNVYSQNYPPLRLKNDVIVYGQLTVNGDSLGVTFANVDSIKIGDQIIRHATGDSLTDLDTVRALVNQAIIIPGGNNEILLSDGVGGTKTDLDFNFDGNRLWLESNSGNNNIFVGVLSASSIDNTAFNNTFIGSRSGFSNTVAFNNTFIGNQTGYNNIGGDLNTYIGSFSGFNKTNGDYNTCIGYESGYTDGGSGNVFLGWQSGYNETGSNKLFIENSNADKDNALVYGEFDNNYLQINGILNVASENFYITPTGDTTDVNTWKYEVKSDTLIYSVFNGVNWNVIQKLIND